MTAPDLPSTPEREDVARRFLNAGVVVPADRAEGAYAAAQRLLATVFWLRKPRTAASEPAHVFAPAGDKA